MFVFSFCSCDRLTVSKVEYCFMLFYNIISEGSTGHVQVKKYMAFSSVDGLFYI